MQKLIVIEGPTACGKTALSIELAKYFKTFIISSDSRQCYKELTIGTAKPTLNERENVKHYFIDSHTIHKPLTASQFETESLEIIQNNSPKLIIVCGGSGMFTDALCIGLDPIPANKEINLKWRRIFEEMGLNFIQKELESKDPDYFLQVDLNNATRIIRALEVIEITQKPFSFFRQNFSQKRPFEVIRFVLNRPREELYNRINLRVDLMVQQGLFEEVDSLRDNAHLSALQTVGYNEIFDHFNLKTTRIEAINLIKQHTRNYAKRQLTYFKRDKNAHWINHFSMKESLNQIVSIIENQTFKSMV